MTTLITLREKLVKIGAKDVSHGRYVTFQLAEVAVPRGLFQKVLDLIDDLRPRPAPAWAEEIHGEVKTKGKNEGSGVFGKRENWPNGLLNTAKSPKSGCRMAVEGKNTSGGAIFGTIALDLKVIWEMSNKLCLGIVDSANSAKGAGLCLPTCLDALARRHR